MSKAQKIINAICDRFNYRGLTIAEHDVRALRRAEMTLHRWCERMCGDSNNVASYYIEREEGTDKPFFVVMPHASSREIRYPIPDREKGALRRVAKICQSYGLHYFYQTDPRGCALYVDSKPLTDTDYNRGIAVCA